MVNDDWSFTLIVQDLVSRGEIATTGWGGGPSALVHLIWGVIWSEIFGFSATTLRCSVLFLGICTSITLFLLLKKLRLSGWLSLLFTLTFTLNPLFLSQSFTFMTDVTFMAMVALSLLFLHLGIEKRAGYLIISGFVFSLLATLTRQLGIVIPLGFLITLFLHPQAGSLNRAGLSLIAISIGVAPWILCELWLSSLGSSVASHPVVQRIVQYPLDLGIVDYGIFLISRAGLICLYCGFFLSPIIILHFKWLKSQVPLKRIVILILVVSGLFELCILLELITPPTGFHRNIIYDFGIGPVLLKDIYLLGIKRTISLPPALFYLLVFYSAISGACLIFLLFQTLLRLWLSLKSKAVSEISFIALLSIVCLIIYSGIIILTGFHDRYLIPLFAFLIIWLADRSFSYPDHSKIPVILMTSAILLSGLLSTLSIRDFMAIKRSQQTAVEYVLSELGADPCEIDGGFEHNGYHCSGQEKPTESGGYSWWWVARERYLISLGPLPDYRIIKTFPYANIIGRDGAIHILQPAGVLLSE